MAELTTQQRQAIAIAQAKRAQSAQSAIQAQPAGFDPAAQLARDPRARFLEGVGIGLKNFKAGLTQLTAIGAPERVLQAQEAAAAEGIAPAPGFERKTRQQTIEAEQVGLAERDVRSEELGLAGQIGAGVGEIGPSVLIPGPKGLQALSPLKRVAATAAVEGAIATADPVREDQTRAENVALAAGTAGVLGGVGGAISRGVRKFTNARTGNLADADAKKLIETAEAEDIPIFFDDVGNSPLAQKASVAAEYFGALGTGKGRATQNVAATDAANRWLQKLSGDVDNFDEVVQESLKNKLNVFKAAATKKYARVSNAIGNAGDVATDNFNGAATVSIAKETAKGTRANPAVIDFLTKFRDAPRGSFDEMIEFRSDFGSQLDTFLRDTELGKTSIDALFGAKNALDLDMSTFAGRNGALPEWRAANQFYQNTVAQFKTSKLKQLTNPKAAGAFDEQAAWKYLVANSSNPARARKMFASLDARGKQAVRFGLIKEAVDVATREGKPFSPAKFAGSIEKRMTVAEQFFRGEQRQEIKGLAQVMRHIQRSGQFAENPPTGQRVIPFLLGGAGLIEPTTIAATTGAALTAKGLFQTKTGRNLLLAASDETPGSKRFDNIMEGITRLAARASNQAQDTTGPQ